MKKAEKHLGCHIDGSEVVVVGDTPKDVACGKYIGARTLAVATGGSSLEELNACGPDWAVPNLNHLSVNDISII